ncbi:MAG TPA: hypothetical protein VLB45_05525 [Nitrosopumilaceae archaeon]|nr:hypothetical protein [Nitrosopumilaceae archaeon]
MTHFIEDDDRERITLLEIVSKKGLRILTKEQLIRLQTLVENKNYGNDKKTMKSKAKLLEKISFEIYNKDKGGFCV